MSEKDGYNHLYNIGLDSGMVTPVTQGKWEVLTIEAADDEKKKFSILQMKQTQGRNNFIRLDTMAKTGPVLPTDGDITMFGSVMTKDLFLMSFLCQHATGIPNDDRSRQGTKKAY